jgi:ABC-type nitrate/sulfonate/bicarbonate transport system permease component
MTYINWLLTNSFFSLLRVIVGVLAAIILGISLGFLRYSLPKKIKHNALFNFLVDMPKYPPPIAWIPFVILWLGIGESSAYVMVFIGAFPSIFTSSYYGAESISTLLIDTAKTFEINYWRYYFRFLLPAVMPRIIVGIRIGLGMGWTSVIAAELIAGQSGLGYSIQLNRINLQYGSMAADMVMIGAIGFILDRFINLIERKIQPWKT